MASANEKIRLYKEGKYTPKNLKEAVKLHCLDCSGEDRELAADCNVPLCLLYHAPLSRKRVRNAGSDKPKGKQPPWLAKKKDTQESASECTNSERGEK